MNTTAPSTANTTGYPPNNSAPSNNNSTGYQSHWSPIYFRAIAIFIGLDGIIRPDAAIFSAPDPETAFKYAHFFIHNRGNQLQGVFYDPSRIAIQRWQNGINQGVVFGDHNLLNF
jgi:hypothetical protein